MRVSKTSKILVSSIIGIIAIVIMGTLFCKYNEKNSKTSEIAISDFRTELFGKNTYIFTPKDDPVEVNKVLSELYAKQETNQFGNERYAIYFMPGKYDSSIEINVGFYMQVAGLGELPTDTVVPSLNCTACNFWRGVENIEIGSNTMWAVSQATSMRRVKIDGALFLHDENGWASGGFLSDAKIDLMTDSGSQQQWLSRNCDWKSWIGANWNLVFLGLKPGCAPIGTWPAKPYTTVDTTPVIQEKPFLMYDEKEGYCVYVPELRTDAQGVSWENNPAGKKVPISEFYVAKSDTDDAQSINAALEKGKNLILTPGIYAIDEPINVTNPDTIVLGMGLATLESKEGVACMKTADVDGLIIAGVLFDAGETESENLLVVGEEDSKEDHTQNPISLSDLYFRVGGASADYAAKSDTCITINSSQVVGDNFWVWRADHGDNVGWDLNTARNGLVVNGDDVTIYALMVEHFLEYQTIWNGNNGKVIMYQSEIPYDVPDQQSWMSHDNSVDGYASFCVTDSVDSFEAWGFGIYSFFRDAAVNLNSAMEVPDKNQVKIHNICSIMITGNPGISHIINNSGKSVMTSGAREIIREYANGIIKE